MGLRAQDTLKPKPLNSLNSGALNLAHEVLLSTNMRFWSWACPLFLCASS